MAETSLRGWRELENLFEEAVVKLGAKTKPAIAEEEFILEYKKYIGVVEYKGVGKSISLESMFDRPIHTC